MSKPDKVLDDNLEFLRECMAMPTVYSVEDILSAFVACMEQWAEDASLGWTDMESPADLEMFLHDRWSEALFDILDEAGTGHSEMMQHLDKQLDAFTDQHVDNWKDGMALARDPYAYYGVSRSDF